MPGVTVRSLVVKAAVGVGVAVGTCVEAGGVADAGAHAIRVSDAPISMIIMVFIIRSAASFII